MKRTALLLSLAALGLAACATATGDPAAMASRQCGNFARAEGTRLVGVQAVEPAGGQSSYRVKLSVEDALNRRITAECMYDVAGKTARWASPLPAGFERL